MNEDSLDSMKALVQRLEANEAARLSDRNKAIQAHDEAHERTAKARNSLALMRDALGLEPSPVAAPSSKRERPLEKPRDRRTVLFTDPAKLKGLRRITWDVMFEAGEAGLSNGEFRDRVWERLDDRMRRKIEAREGGRRRALMDGHLVLRRNVEHFGYAMSKIGDDVWVLRKKSARG